MSGRALRFATEALLAAAAAAFGLAICLHHGRMGLMPLDQSIVFDGGWRVLSGQVPWRDFTMPVGLVPILMQAIVFQFLGVTWFAYCLHAALVNGLFCILVYLLLRLLGLPMLAAVLYAALSGILFYAPFGVPFPDQHAFFFSIAAVVCAVAALQDISSRWRWGLASAAGVFWVGAMLCKQIPSAFVLPVLLGLTLAQPAGRRARAASALGLGVGLAVLLVAAALAAWGSELGLFLEYVIRLPSGEGHGRLAPLLEEWNPDTVHEIARAWGLRSIPLSLGAAVFVVLTARGSMPRDRSLSRLAVALSLALVAVCGAFCALTNNEPENGIAFGLAAVGAGHAALHNALSRHSRACRVAGLLLLAVATLDAQRFDARVNAGRMVHDLQDEPVVASARSELPVELSFLIWRIHYFYQYTPGDLGRLIAFLRVTPGNFLLIGDTSILYGLTARPPASPSLWFHRGLSLPDREQPGFADYEGRLLHRLDGLALRFVILEGRETYQLTRLGDFPRLEAEVEARAVGRQSFGPFEVIELSQGAR